MRVHFRNMEFISTDELREVYKIDLYDGWFNDISEVNKFILVKKEFFNDALTIAKKIRTDILIPIINHIHILTCDMLKEKIQESDIIGFLESDFNKFISVKYMNDNFYRKL